MGINKIILDCDPGHDDALAILLALSSPNEIKCLGLTISAGNVSLELTSENALRVLSLVNNQEIPVYKGCPKPLVSQLVTAEHVHGESGLDTGSGTSLPQMAFPYFGFCSFLIIFSTTFADERTPGNPAPGCTPDDEKYKLFI